MARGFRKSEESRILGMPRVPAYTVVPTTRARRRLCTGVDGASGLGADPSLFDEFFQKIVEACMEKWSTNRTLFLSGAPSRQRIYQLAQEVVHSSINSGSRDELLGLVSQEVIRVCTVVFANLFPPHMRQVNENINFWLCFK